MLKKRVFFTKDCLLFIDKTNEVYYIEDEERKIKETLNFPKCEDDEAIKEELLEYGILYHRNELEVLEKVLVVGNEKIVDYFSKNIKSYLKKYFIFSNVPEYNFNDIKFAVYLDFFDDFDKLLEINNKLQRNYIPWLKCIYMEDKLLLGPEFIPKQTSCYKCMYSRMLANENDLTGLFEQNELLKKVYDSNEFSIEDRIDDDCSQTFTNIIISELLNIANNIHNCINVEKEIDVRKWEIKNRYILKVPGCDCNA